jgi:hypothetical protein
MAAASTRVASPMASGMRFGAAVSSSESSRPLSLRDEDDREDRDDLEEGEGSGEGERMS